MKQPFEPERLLHVARTFGTPTYVYSEAVVRRQIDRLRTHLAGLPLRLLYAMKANASPALLRLMRDEGLGIDAVSPGELEVALRTGFPPDRILFSANNMTDEEMHLAHGKGVLLNIGELSRLERYGRAYPGAEVCVRLNPQVGAGHHEHVITAGERSKFGIPVARLDEVRAVVARHGLRLVGLHQHIGSGILSAEVLWQAVRVLLDAARSFSGLRFLNFGGGLGIPYRPDEAPLDFDRFQQLIVDPLRAYLAEHPSKGMACWFEPGRFLVAEAGVLLMRVNTLKEANGRWFAGTDSGMSHLVRPAIYGAYHALFNLSNPAGPLRTYDVVGNICESADHFARDREVQEIREGDVLAVLDAGAYGMSMASHYNLRALPAEVFLPAGPEAPPVLLRRRRTPQEVAEAWLAETTAGTAP
ncbi:diaminopimelate decarboxylase [Rhodocaloribacter litoris]|uniref:diaminopimelate decarboxylase n=1 Tax=Rhodocaloribacter litoris TaxID=2558931 RepID=UPI001421D497|nr:diaminopimelate decarboxylase [Rhodocaloribacter litoris]QXD16003.1 diaminopimelate decarboxylase [Rhodocaloribacter litoris]